MLSSNLRNLGAFVGALTSFVLLASNALAQEPMQPPPQTQPTYVQAYPAQPMQVVVVDAPEPRRPNRVSVGPLGLLLGVGSFTYERALSDKFSIEISPTVLYWGFGDASIYGGALGIGGAYYLSGQAPEGLRLSASVGPGFVSAEDDDTDAETVFLFGARTTLGYNWVWSDGFSLGLGAGLQYVHISGDDVDSAFNGLLPAIDFNFGFAF